MFWIFHFGTVISMYTHIFVGKKVGTSSVVTHSKPNWAPTSAFLQKSKFLMKMFWRLLVRCKYSFAQMVPVPETISQDALFHFKLESHSLLLTKFSSSIFRESFCVQLNSIIFAPNMILNCPTYSSTCFFVQLAPLGGTLGHLKSD